MAISHIELKRGNTYESTIEVTDSKGRSIDLTGWSLRFMAKRNLDDTDADAAMDYPADADGDPISGIASFTFPASETSRLDVGTYFCAFQLIDAEGTVVETDTTYLDVIADVIRSTTA